MNYWVLLNNWFVIDTHWFVKAELIIYLYKYVNTIKHNKDVLINLELNMYYCLYITYTY